MGLALGQPNQLQHGYLGREECRLSGRETSAFGRYNPDRRRRQVFRFWKPRSASTFGTRNPTFGRGDPQSPNLSGGETHRAARFDAPAVRGTPAFGSWNPRRTTFGSENPGGVSELSGAETPGVERATLFRAREPTPRSPWGRSRLSGDETPVELSTTFGSGNPAASRVKSFRAAKPPQALSGEKTLNHAGEGASARDHAWLHCPCGCHE